MTHGTIDAHDPRRRTRGGMITMVNCVAIVFCCLLIVMIMNVGHLVHQKVETQNAADAVAYTGAVWTARGMNAITATNHVMGEMMSFVVLHEAIGGQRLEHPEMGPADTSEADALLDAAYAAASAAGASTFAYETVRQREGVFADRTLLESKIRLKEWLAFIYRMKVVAKAMQASSIPPIVAAGVALERAMDAFEYVILTEYRILLAFHQVAENLLDLKRLLRDEMLPEAKRYTRYVVDRTPVLAQRAAEMIAEANGSHGTLFPLPLVMPVMVDPFARAMFPNIPDSQRVAATQSAPACPSPEATNMREQVVKTSQLARATWPWVNYHREPILQVLGVLVPFSNARDHYFDHTAGAAKYLCDVLQRDSHDLGLYVLRDYPAPDKGYALWTEDPVAADDLFSIVGLSHRDRTLVISDPILYQQEHHAGRLAISQALVYNANAQQRHPHHHRLLCRRIIPIRQADVGWDTLNWRSGSRPYELIGIGAGIVPEFPEIEINWQAKLVPITANRFRQLRNASNLPDRFRGVLDRLVPELSPSLRTH